MDLRRMSNYLTNKTTFKQCYKLQNPTLKEIEDQLLDIHEQLPQKSESVVLIYFSGKAKPYILDNPKT